MNSDIDIIKNERETIQIGTMEMEMKEVREDINCETNLIQSIDRTIKFINKYEKNKETIESFGTFCLRTYGKSPNLYNKM